MSVTNEMELKFDSRAENEGFARVAVGAFFAQLNPTLEEICDVKTAISEAVTNSIIHGYSEAIQPIIIRCQLHSEKRELWVEVEDQGCGISNVEQAMEPLFTTKSEMDRAGMGFAFMEAFMDEIAVESEVGSGTRIKMKKIVSKIEGKGSDDEETWIKQSL